MFTFFAQVWASLHAIYQVDKIPDSYNVSACSNFYLLPQDVYFDDESAEVVISSLRLGDEHDRYFLVYALCIVCALS